MKQKNNTDVVISCRSSPFYFYNNPMEMVETKGKYNRLITMELYLLFFCIKHKIK